VIQLSPEQLLEIALAVGSAALAIVAGVFLLVLHATRRRRGVGWFWSWAFLAVAFGLTALAQEQPKHKMWFALTATCAAILCGFGGIVGAFSFRDEERAPAWSIAAFAFAGAAALAVQARTDLFGDLLAPEIPLFASVAIQAIALLPLARSARMAGLQTACAVDIALALMLGRTLLSGGALALRGQELTQLYWTFETIGGIILAFLLAMGELIALLDEVRVDLERANGALNEALEGLEVAAKLDPLTGLYNRYAFYTLVNELSERGRFGGTIAIVDLNSLKRINDTFGHHAGDRALLNTAMRLQEVVRQSDYVFRWGGDEFVLLLFGMPPEYARDRLAYMHPPAALEIPDHEPVALTVSWGVAVLQADVDAALREADAQLYAQKRLFMNAAGKIASP
jgi:diguanylate cyclase (GGDEF)-like protein